MQSTACPVAPGRADFTAATTRLSKAMLHSRQAVELHALNRPYTRHYVEDA